MFLPSEFQLSTIKHIDGFDKILKVFHLNHSIAHNMKH